MLRDDVVRELMDDPNCDPGRLQRTYAQFKLVNAVVSGARATYRKWIWPRLSAGRAIHMLDIGTGGGDLPRRMLHWAQTEGLQLTITAIDTDQRALDFAAKQNIAGLKLRAASTKELVASGEHFDIVISNHVLHHLTGQEFGVLLRDCERITAPGGIVVHSDIERSRLAYAAFSLGTLPFARNLLADSFIRADGLTSIRRSHTAAELSVMLPRGWHVRRVAPARLEVLWREGLDDRTGS